MVADCGANCARWLLCLSNFVFMVSIIVEKLLEDSGLTPFHFQVVATGVLLVGSWLAADKASFIK